MVWYMYLRATERKNKNGSTVRYLQLAHNEWDAAAGVSRPRVLHNFGRADQLDRAAVTRLIASLSRVVEPAQALAATAGTELEFSESRPMGGAYVLDGLWQRLGIDGSPRRGCRRQGSPPRPSAPRSQTSSSSDLLDIPTPQNDPEPQQVQRAAYSAAHSRSRRPLDGRECQLQ